MTFASLTRRSAVALLGSAAILGATTAFAQNPKTYALVQINQQALFFNQINEGAQKAADTAGANLAIFNANNDPQAQNSAIETFIEQKVDGIVVVAIDVNGIMPAVEQAAAAGIPVVAIDAILPAGPQKAQIGVDNGKTSADIAHFFVEQTGDAPAKIGIVGALNSFIQNIRKDDFEAVLKDHDNITVAGTVDGQNVQDVALGAAENLLTANPDLTAIYATGEPAMVAAVAAVESQGRQDSVKVYGWDLTQSVIDGIDAGFVAGVVQQDPAGMGTAAIEALDKIVKGEPVDAVVSVPAAIVTTENVDGFRDMFK
ncbi:substrate-binding domain-containing protein [Paenirhodobacter populi]|uniref:Sugar ABC transporter substrate-binding protein n=1 Tax=Paenirhodobacter populi TaxID=2306993 RepID=A0A443K579_9RHOB|nr:substrate-binding domain-containing protein [Sinirhodobacter populi]RWR07343.1 sugar ABC transporter substrate-binding protein [Sinirhodobacter populi]RWR27929.1 sugar ABC transporter substrate-binding protein [Sinirhodobacter populi]